MEIACKKKMKLISQKMKLTCTSQKLQCVGSAFRDPAKETLDALDESERWRFDRLEPSRKRVIYRKLQETELKERKKSASQIGPEIRSIREQAGEKKKESLPYGSGDFGQKVVFPDGKAGRVSQDHQLALRGSLEQEWRQEENQKFLRELLRTFGRSHGLQIHAVRASRIPAIKKWRLNVSKQEMRIRYFTGIRANGKERKGQALAWRPAPFLRSGGWKGRSDRAEEKTTRAPTYLGITEPEKKIESRRFTQQDSSLFQASGEKMRFPAAEKPGNSMGSQALQSARRMIQNQFSAQLQKEETKKEMQAETYAQESGTVAAATAVSKSKNPLLKALSGFFVVMVQLITKVLLSKLLLVLLCLMGIIAAVATLFSLVTIQTTGRAEANVSAEVEFYRPYLEEEAAKYEGMSQLVDLMLALIQQEAGGEPWIGTMDGDVMQSSESAGYPGPGYLTGMDSIRQGVKYLYGIFRKTGLLADPYNLELTKISLQSYNFGIGYYSWMKEQGYDTWSFQTAVAYAKIGASSMGWSIYRTNTTLIAYAGPINYGDQRYPEHVLQYYEITSGEGIYGEGGMPIPLYYQWEYGGVAYGGGSIATSGCGPTSFAMVASYLTGQTITPVDAISWCGNAYYVPGAGTSWGYFSGACSHFGLAAPVQTNDMQAVLLALQEGKPVISSQGPGLFTSAGHFIVLRGVDENGRVFVNDPNDNSSKNYQNRAFDMASEIDSTALSYWIFSK